jgi:hypothetical protein
MQWKQCQKEGAFIGGRESARSATGDVEEEKMSKQPQ